MKFPVRLIFGCLIIFISLLLFKHIVFAQSVNQTQQTSQTSYNAPNTNPDVPKNLHTYSQSVLLEVASAMSCQIAGIDPTTADRKCLGFDKKTGKIGYAEGGGGAIAVVGSMIGSMYTNPPVYFRDYVAYVSNNFGFAKKTYAQTTGIGFDGLTPVLGLWTTFRNMSYVLFIIIFIVVGVAIMLRVRIDPRTVMSIQNQIPKLIIGIILVTFSYAIAGFLIDIMWVTTYAAVRTIVPLTTNPTLNSENVTLNATQAAPGFVNYVYTAGDPSGISVSGIPAVAFNSATAIGGLVFDLFNSDALKPQQAPGETGCGINPLCIVQNFFGGVLQDIIGGILGIVIGFIVGVIAFLIIAIALLVALIKLWFALIKAYVFILFDVILAPFWIMAGLIPGASPGIGFGAWLRDIMGNLMAFPAVVGLFLMGKVIIDGFTHGTGTAFNPPLVGNVSGDPTRFAALIALGIILISPNVVEMTKKAFKAQGLVTGLGKAIGAGPTILGSTVGFVSQGLSLRYQWRFLHPNKTDVEKGPANPPTQPGEGH